MAPCQDNRLSSTATFESVSLRRSQGVEEEQSSGSPYVFPSPTQARQAYSQCQACMADDFEKAGVPYFPIYNLRHVFCTRLSWVAPDAVVQRAMRHSSPETKRHYQLGMVDQVREGIELANERAYHGKQNTTFLLRSAQAEKEPARGFVVSD